VNRLEFLCAPVGSLREVPLLYYVGGYKFQSRNDMIYQVFIFPDEDIITDLIVLRKDGWLWVSKYFAWDGCSGPTIDTITNMRAGHAHDALYALFRMGKLNPATWRPQADWVLGDLMRRDGASRARAWYYEKAVNTFAGWAADPKNAKRILVAPSRKNMIKGMPA
jgi:hypothetical protein